MFVRCLKFKKCKPGLSPLFWNFFPLPIFSCQSWLMTPPYLSHPNWKSRLIEDFLFLVDHPVFSKELKNPTDKISYLFLKLFLLYFYHLSNLGLHFTYLGYCNYILDLPALSLDASNMSSIWQVRVYIKNENMTMLKLPVTPIT